MQLPKFVLDEVLSLEEIPIHFRDIVRKQNEFMHGMERALLSKGTYIDGIVMLREISITT